MTTRQPENCGTQISTGKHAHNNFKKSMLSRRAASISNGGIHRSAKILPGASDFCQLPPNQSKPKTAPNPEKEESVWIRTVRQGGAKFDGHNPLSDGAILVHHNNSAVKSLVTRKQ